MNRVLARALTRLYPPQWRQRYADEFTIFLEDDAGGLHSVASVVWSAFYEHILSAGEPLMNRPQHAMGLVVASFLAAVAGGVNLVATVDDSSLVPLMQSNSGMRVAWDALAAAAIISGVAVVLLAFPLYRSMFVSAWRQRRNDLLLRLCVPVIGGGMLLLWGAAGLAYSGGKWVPSPWAILSAGGAPSTWPDLNIRWITGVISVALTGVVVLASVISFQQAIRLSPFDSQVDTQFTSPGASARRKTLFVRAAMQVAFAGTLLMVLAVCSWGILMQTQAHDLFQQHFGLLGCTASTSWLISVCLFVIASAASMRGSLMVRTAATPPAP